MKSYKNVGIILLKERSARLPKKNYMQFMGKPMFKHIYDEAIKSKLFTHVVISTESEMLIKLCKKHKVPIYFKRPKKLASNKSSLNSVILDAIKKNELIFKNCKYFCLLWATAPMVTKLDLQKSFLKNKKKGNDAVIGVKKSYDYFSMLELNKKKKLVSVIKNKKDISILRKQDIMPKYIINSSFAWIKLKNFLKSKTWLLPNKVPYVMELERSIDIDYPHDLKLLKYFYKNYK